MASGLAALLALTGGSVLLSRRPAPQSAPAWADADRLDTLARYVAPATESGEEVAASAFAPPRADPFTGSSAPVMTAEPPASAPARVATWHVSAILIAGERRLAVINDRLVGPGDRLADGARVEDVRPGEVVVQPAGGARRVVKVDAGGGV